MNSMWLLFLSSFVVVIVTAFECPNCNSRDCPDSCEYGTALDLCGCCVCALKEGDLCDQPPTDPSDVRAVEPIYGPCGRFLKCLPLSLAYESQAGKSSALMEDERAICQCELRQTICGSDGITYESICALHEVVTREKRSITVARLEPCDSPPEITSSPSEKLVQPGNKVTLTCEIKGYPMPLVVWYRRVERKLVAMPDDDRWMSVSYRGGPNDNQISSWLQVTNFKPDRHEGTYVCLAQNRLGRTQAAVRLRQVETTDIDNLP